MAEVSSIAEFDAVAAEYAQQHAQSISFSGEEPEYFAEYKARRVAETYQSEQAPMPEQILDFGAGIGNSVAPLRRHFPKAQLVCLDVSQASLDICATRFGSAVTTKLFDGHDIPLSDNSVDMAFIACVFHHIDPSGHHAALRELHRVLRPGAHLFLFEHNPWNPATRIAVANCPFDENAILIDPITMRRRVAAVGFERCRIKFGPFFPAFLSKLRPAERLLSWLPMGAQYFVHSQKR